jgi:Tol biopolymer transport system component
MPRIGMSVILLLLMVTISISSYSQDEFPVLSGPYLGQKPPGLIPQIFAPGIVSIKDRFEGAISFSPALDEVYFSVDSQDRKTSVYFSKIKDDQWTPIKKVSFTQGEKDEELHPFVSPNGKRIYFTAVSSDLSDPRIWYVDRLEDSWSRAIELDSPINDNKVFFPNQAKNGDLYYFNISAFKTYYAPNRHGRFPETKQLAIEFGDHAFISPNQDYLVVTGRNREDESRKDRDIYVYFKTQDGTWTQPVNLGKTINSDFNEKGPRISHDGKYLFFGRDERDGERGFGDIYWVSTKLIENLKPDL